MRPRTSATLATTAAVASMVLLAGCGGSPSEATTSTATSTAPIRQAAGGDVSSYAAAIISLPGSAYSRAIYEIANDHCIRTGFEGQYGTGNSYSCGLADSLRCSVTGAGCESRGGRFGGFGRGPR